MRVFLDTNIMLDHILDRRPFSEDASKLMLLLRLGEIEGWCGASQCTDLFYVLTNGASSATPSEARASIRKLREVVHGCALADEDAELALDSGWDDFEDACIHQMALKVRADAIVTRNLGDFARSSIPALDCPHLFAHLRENLDLDYAEVLL